MIFIRLGRIFNHKKTSVLGQFFEFQGIRPVVDPSSFVSPSATVIGNVIIGKDVYIGPGAVLRGDWGKIVIEDGCNVQENCVIHMFPGTTVLLKAGAHIGHGAIIHGATIGENSLIGMNAVVMDDSIIGKESIVGALSFVGANTVFEPRSVVVGNPAKVIKPVSDKMLAWKTKGTEFYQQLPAQCFNSLRACKPLTEEEKGRKIQAKTYATWKSQN